MKLPTRKKQTKKPTDLPTEFLRAVAELFQKQFKKESKGAEFLVYGNLFPSEVIFCVSLVHPKTLRAATMHLSLDLDGEDSENPEKVTEKLKVMVDVSASWFGQCLQGGDGIESILEEMAEMDPTWQNLEWEGSTMYVKLNKDNYALEKAANEFLKKKGVDIEAEEDELSDEEIEAILNDDDGDGRGPIH